MKALVTGGAGFIGSNLCKELGKMGVDVCALDDLSSGYSRNLHGLQRVQLLEGDIRDEALVRKAMDGCEVVFHLAASVGNKRSIDFPEIDTDINVNGTLRILKAADAANVRKIVVSSSAGIYGELKSIPIKEDHPIDPLTPYGVSKLYTEKMALAFANVFDIEAISLRYFNVYGPNQRFDAYGNVIPIFAFRALAGEPIQIFGDGTQTRDFVHVADVVQANIAAALNVGTSGAFNIASGTQTCILDLAHAVIGHGGKPVDVVHTDERAGDVAHSLADISAARESFGFKPSIDIWPGLQAYMEWARHEASSAT